MKKVNYTPAILYVIGHKNKDGLNEAINAAAKQYSSNNEEYMKIYGFLKSLVW